MAANSEIHWFPPPIEKSQKPFHSRSLYCIRSARWQCISAHVGGWHRQVVPLPSKAMGANEMIRCPRSQLNEWTSPHACPFLITRWNERDKRQRVCAMSTKRIRMVLWFMPFMHMLSIRTVNRHLSWNPNGTRVYQLSFGRYRVPHDGMNISRSERCDE